MKARLACAVALAALATACAPVPRAAKDYGKLLAAAPRSILVVPVLNQTVAVDAADYFLSTIPVPLAERGYYVFPVHMVKRVLEDDGLGDAGLVHSSDPARLASLFGADAVLYVTIERWDAKYLLIQTNVTVAVSYALRDGKTGELLWRESRVATYASDSGGNSGSGSLIVALVSAAVTKASPDYLPLARQANAGALAYPGPGLPAGPHHPAHGRDLPAVSAAP